ncbi:MAG TPA: YciI family protein [Acidimicrobiales bacterium]|nr:YciI family protein [Acidimicrobiales bacterium]
MRYLLMIYGDEAGQAAMSPEEGAQMMAAYDKFGDEYGAKGVLRGGERLRPTSDATTVQVRGGELTTSDGPYAETKEQIGGFYLIESDNLDEAVAVAAAIPAAHFGTIEVRPIWEM